MKFQNLIAITILVALAGAAENAAENESEFNNQLD